jgi:hypothetical protein
MNAGTNTSTLLLSGGKRYVPLKTLVLSECHTRCAYKMLQVALRIRRLHAISNRAGVDIISTVDMQLNRGIHFISNDIPGIWCNIIIIIPGSL